MNQRIVHDAAHAVTLKLFKKLQAWTLPERHRDLFGELYQHVRIGMVDYARSYDHLLLRLYRKEELGLHETLQGNDDALSIQPAIPSQELSE